jgi:hypothetical protein
MKRFYIGGIVRIAPNEVGATPTDLREPCSTNTLKLLYAKPSAYLELYNFMRRWDKDELLYLAFIEDHASFGFPTYKQASQGKNAVNWLFSKQGIMDAHSIIDSRL